MIERPSLPKGTRDFGPAVMAKRQFIFNTIRSVFERYGFLPLETPAMENLSTLTGKYGEEGDQLLFKILDSGEYFEKFKKNISQGSRIAQIKDAIQDFLKSISVRAFSQLENDELRDVEKLYSLYDMEYSKQSWIAVRQLTPGDKELIKNFLLEKGVYLSYELTEFYHKAGLYRENFAEKFDHHFRQFRDNVLNKLLLSNVLEYISSKDLSVEIADKGLKYDLTVPFARYVVMNRHEITFPFKRYQIQPVWRADKPQKGRYREFYQCDADVVGTDSLVCEAEIILMIKEVLNKLGFKNYSIKINHRSLLSGIAEQLGLADKETILFAAMDKLEKVGKTKVREELLSKGFKDPSIMALYEIINPERTTEKKIQDLNDFGINSDKVKKGIDDIYTVFNLLQSFSDNLDNIEFDIALARGLSYYTGCIFEVKIANVAVGSVSGGGRYDNLTAVFDSKEKSSGVGFSFGVDRLYDAMEELNLFPEETRRSSTVLVCHLDEACLQHGLGITQSLRASGIAAEIYPDISKVKKQLEYADKKHIPYAVVIGSEEMTSGLLSVKNLKSGEQQKQTLEQLVKTLTTAAS